MRSADKKYEDKKIQGENIGPGNILIPDISGFTSFVTQTDIVSGQIITKRLLTSLLVNDLLDLELSEIEGDAALLYKYGRKLRPNDILKQYELMLENFHSAQELVNKEVIYQ